MRILILALVAAFATGSLSCGGGVKHYRPTAETNPIPLMIWVDPDTDLPKEEMLKACQEWRVKGIECQLVGSKYRADVRVHSDTKDACTRDKDGTRTLATARKGGRIVFYRKCYGGQGGKFYKHKFRAVAVHEIGHQLGIWKHVPFSCDVKDMKKHPNGKKVCGQAVMNPHYDPKVHFVTPVDGLAFDLRNRFIGVVADDDGDDEPSDEPDCIYYGK